MIPPTKKGYGLFEAKSAFQKAIRRNEEDLALYFLVEFFNSGLEEAVWRQMMVIASEDVGLADPDMCIRINALYQNFQVLKKSNNDNRPERLCMVHAVIALCRAPKSRYVDWEMIKIWRDHGEDKRELPDWVYDMHTRKGKAQGKDVDDFYNNGTHLENHHPVTGEANIKRRALELHKLTPGKLRFELTKKGTQQTFNL